MLIQTFGNLKRLSPTWPAPRAAGVSWSAGSPSWGASSLGLAADYAAIYRSQPAVRVCVDFLSRNLAQIGMHVFKRTPASDSRSRVREGLETLWRTPNPWTCGNRLMRDMVGDLSIYGSAYWLKLPRAENGYALVRLFPPAVVVIGTSVVPTGYQWTIDGRTVEAPPDRIVHFRWYDPESSFHGVSPLETLRRTLAEERAASEYRNALWKNGARIPGYISRPKEAREWNDQQRIRFREQFNALYGGAQNAGKIPVLEDGMTFNEASFTSSDAQYIESRKLNTEEVARVYQIPLPMAGILDHATFSNVREQHKHLYQDCFSPILAMIEGDLDLQLLPEFHDPATHYVEFNLSEKLKGSFEEQALAVMRLVGGPVLTVDEGRSLLNRPAMGGAAAELLRPLNMTTDPEVDGDAARVTRESGGAADGGADGAAPVVARPEPEILERRPRAVA